MYGRQEGSGRRGQSEKLTAGEQNTLHFCPNPRYTQSDTTASPHIALQHGRAQKSSHIKTVRRNFFSNRFSFDGAALCTLLSACGCDKRSAV
jgi:hypothetical protein